MVAGLRDVLLPGVERFQVVPVRLILQGLGELEILLLPAHAIQLHEALRDSRDGCARWNDMLPPVVGGKHPHDVIRHDFRVRQGLRISRHPVVPHQRQIDVLLLVEDPVDNVLVVVRFDVPEAQVSVGIARAPQLVHDVLGAFGHFRLAGVLSKQTAGVQNLADAVVHVALVPAIRSVPELVQPVPVQVENHVVLLDQVHDAPVQLAACHLAVSEPDRNQLVANDRFDDVPFAHGQCACRGNEHRDGGEPLDVFHMAFLFVAQSVELFFIVSFWNLIADPPFPSRRCKW